jgi:hypothetical protein
MIHVSKTRTFSCTAFLCIKQTSSPHSRNLFSRWRKGSDTATGSGWAECSAEPVPFFFPLPFWQNNGFRKGHAIRCQKPGQTKSLSLSSSPQILWAKWYNSGFVVIATTKRKPRSTKLESIGENWSIFALRGIISGPTIKLTMSMLVRTMLPREYWCYLFQDQQTTDSFQFPLM